MFFLRLNLLYMFYETVRRDDPKGTQRRVRPTRRRVRLCEIACSLCCSRQTSEKRNFPFKISPDTGAFLFSAG